MVTYKLQSLRATSDSVIRKYQVFSKVYDLIIMFIMFKVKYLQLLSNFLYEYCFYSGNADL